VKQGGDRGVETLLAEGDGHRQVGAGLAAEVARLLGEGERAGGHLPGLVDLALSGQAQDCLLSPELSDLARSVA
jgi:hypothetical protein